MSNQPPDDDLANVSTNLTALANARARVQIDAAATDADTVGWVLAAHRAGAGVTVEALADWLGLDLPSLADLAQELRPGSAARRWASTSWPSCTAQIEHGCVRRSLREADKRALSASESSSRSCKWSFLTLTITIAGAEHFRRSTPGRDAHGGGAGATGA